jgi:hypothetical protein
VAAAAIVAAFAPRVEQLACYTLELAATEAPGAALEALTHLHAFDVEVAGAASKADGVAALRHALPRLAVLVYAPTVHAADDSWEASLDEVLAALPGVTAVRGFLRDKLPGVRAPSLTRLQQLAVYDYSWSSAGSRLLPALPHMIRLAGLTALVAPAGTAVIPVCVLEPVAAEVAGPVQLAAPVEIRRNGVGATGAVAARVGSFAVSGRVGAEAVATPVARVMGSAPRLGDGRDGGQAQAGDGDKGETDHG